MAGTFVWIVLILSVFAVGEVSLCYTHGYTNGCSIPFNMPYFYKETFRPDCDQHDVCYACGVNNGKTRRECDLIFYQNLLDRCNTEVAVNNRNFCRSVALDYFLAVRVGGRSHFKNTPLYWCDRWWVDYCI